MRPDDATKPLALDPPTWGAAAVALTLPHPPRVAGGAEPTGVDQSTGGWLQVVVGRPTSARVLRWAFMLAVACLSVPSVLHPLLYSTDARLVGVAAPWALLAVMLGPLVVIDIAIMRLPTPLIGVAALLTAACAAGCVAAGTLAASDLVRAAWAAALGGGVFGALWLFYPAGALGLGDVRLAALCAAGLGLHSIAACQVGLLILPVVLGALLFPLLASRSRSGPADSPASSPGGSPAGSPGGSPADSRVTGVPFAPMLAGGTWLVMVCPALIGWLS